MDGARGNDFWRTTFPLGTVRVRRVHGKMKPWRPESGIYVSIIFSHSRAPAGEESGEVGGTYGEERNDRCFEGDAIGRARIRKRASLETGRDREARRSEQATSFETG
jgi:hypothetical protein